MATGDPCLACGKIGCNCAGRPIVPSGSFYLAPKEPTIRLEFIKAAMQGLAANPTIPTEPEFIAKHALILADATLRAAGVDDA